MAGTAGYEMPDDAAAKLKPWIEGNRKSELVGQRPLDADRVWRPPARHKRCGSAAIPPPT